MSRRRQWFGWKWHI